MNIATVLRVRVVSFTVAGVNSSILIFTSGSGARAPVAAALAMRSIASSTCLRTSSLVVRTVSCSFTSLGMMLCLVPPWIEPTVTTAGVDRVHSRG